MSEFPLKVHQRGYGNMDLGCVYDYVLDLPQRRLDAGTALAIDRDVLCGVQFMHSKPRC